jgi:hypothetical protein
MKTKHLSLLAPTVAALALLTQGCVYDDYYYGSGGYYGGTVASGAVSTGGFTLSYGSGWMGPGYYWGPPGLSYYRYTPGVYYYRTREAVPHHYWRHWHGDHRHGPYRGHRYYRRY